MSRGRRKRGLRFSVFGTPVRIGWTYPLVIAGLPLLMAGHLLLGDGPEPDLPLPLPVMIVGWLVLVTVSVLIHEGGHVLALRSFGFHPEVSLNALGGLTSATDDDRYLSPGRSIIVSLAGPITAAAFGITVEMGLMPIAGRGVDAVRAASWFVNIWWTAFNLLPIMPLDGGHVMRELVTMTSRRRGGAIPALIVLMVGLAAGAWWWLGDDHPEWVALGIGLMVATNIGFFAFTEQQRKVQDITIAHEQLMRGELDPALATLLPIAWSQDARLIPDSAYTTMGWALLHQRRFLELCELDDQRFHPTHRPYLVAATSWFRGDLSQAMSLVGNALAEGRMTPPDTYFRRVFGRLGELDRLGQSLAALPGDGRIVAGQRFRERVLAAAD